MSEDQQQNQVNPQIPYSKYTSEHTRHLGADYNAYKYSNFAEMLSLDILKHLFVKRNTRKGTQYRIVDIFGKDFLFYMAFLNDGEFSITSSNGNYKYYVCGNPVKVDTSLMAKLMPRGIPQTRKQLNTWVNYLAYLANQKFDK